MKRCQWQQLMCTLAPSCRSSPPPVYHSLAPLICPAADFAFAHLVASCMHAQGPVIRDQDALQPLPVTGSAKFSPVSRPPIHPASQSLELPSTPSAPASSTPQATPPRSVLGILQLAHGACPTLNPDPTCFRGSSTSEARLRHTCTTQPSATTALSRVRTSSILSKAADKHGGWQLACLHSLAAFMSAPAAVAMRCCTLLCGVPRCKGKHIPAPSGVGGAIYADAGSALTLQRTNFVFNSAVYGGTVYSTNSQTFVTGCSFLNGFAFQVSHLLQPAKRCPDAASWSGVPFSGGPCCRQRCQS